MGLPVFRITPVAGKGKVKIVHQNLILPFVYNIKGDSENDGCQQGVDGLPDCILAVSDDGVPGTEVVSTDPEPMGEGDASHLQWVQTEVKLNYWVQTIWGWVKSILTPMLWNYCLQIHQWVPSGLCHMLAKVNFAIWMAWCVLWISRQLRGRGHIVEECVSARNPLSPRIWRSGNFFSWKCEEIVKLGLNGDTFWHESWG